MDKMTLANLAAIATVVVIFYAEIAIVKRNRWHESWDQYWASGGSGWDPIMSFISRTIAEIKSKKWTCDSCGALCQESATLCENCGKPKPPEDEENSEEQHPTSSGTENT
jgi:hypothetical protein